MVEAEGRSSGAGRGNKLHAARIEREREREREREWARRRRKAGRAEGRKRRGERVADSSLGRTIAERVRMRFAKSTAWMEYSKT